MRSKDLRTWTDLSVDYRAVGTRVMLAESGGRQWAATERRYDSQFDSRVMLLLTTVDEAIVEVRLRFL